jgi:hypothetical protein
MSLQDLEWQGFIWSCLELTKRWSISYGVLYNSTPGDLWETYGYMLKGNLLRVSLSLRPLYLYHALAIVEDLTHSISSHLLMYTTTMKIHLLWQLRCTCGCLLYGASCEVNSSCHVLLSALCSNKREGGDLMELSCGWLLCQAAKTDDAGDGRVDAARGVGCVHP